MAPLRELLEKTFGALAFADAGEPELAMAMAGVTACRAADAKLEDAFAAVAFAEADRRDEALEMLGCQPALRRRRNAFLDSVGLGDVPVFYGVANA